MSMSDPPLEEAKRRVTIAEAWRTLGLPNPPPREEGNFKSPVRDERHPSLSMFSGGRAFCDHATGAKGDVIAFIRYCLGCNFVEAKAQLLAVAGITPTTGKFRQLKPRSIPAPAISKKLMPEPMDGSPLADYDEGVEHLLNHPERCAEIDETRSWPIGTTVTLAEDNLISTPLLKSQRVIAFAVQAPFTSPDGSITTKDVSFHARITPAQESERPRWLFAPTGKGSWPFVLGSGHITTATTIHICEGQWDAVALVTHSGWLKGDSTWPDHTVVFGIRGAGSTKLLLEHWLSKAPLTARIIIYPDGDEAGDKATSKLANELTKQGFDDVEVFTPIERGDDLSDYLRKVTSK